MTYLEARNKLLAISDDHFHMQENVPERPMKYCKPEYYISIHYRDILVASGLHCKSWEKALAEVEEGIEQIEIGIFSAKLYSGEVAA